MKNPVPSTKTKTGVFWTQFAADSLTGADGRPVDWSDHRDAHRAVSRLYPPRLPGEASMRRATSGILYRVDVMASGVTPTILVQSLIAPELTPSESRTTEVSRRAWDTSVGMKVAFRLAVNPVVRTTRYFADPEKTRLALRTPGPLMEGNERSVHSRQTARVVPMAEAEAWSNAKLSGALDRVEIVNHFRDTTVSGRHQVVVDTFDGFALVADPSRLNDLRLTGVGRSKAYGCGLLTVTRFE